MVLRNALAAAGVLISLLVFSAAHAEEDIFTITGVVWVDENRDGIRQPSEPVLPGTFVDVGRVWSPTYFRQHDPPPRVRADEKGEYTFWGVHHENTPISLQVQVYYLRPGSGPVLEYTQHLHGKGLWTVNFSHIGCASLHLLPHETERVLNVRVVQIRTYGGSFYPTEDWPVADGHFFKHPPRGCVAGFSVTNADGIPFWDTWQQLGLENVGRPRSHRFVWRELVTQVFEKAIFQWDPGKGVSFLSIFDELHKAEKDYGLDESWSIPRPLEASAGSEEETTRRRLALLDANAAIKERYYSVPDPLRVWGLPTSSVEDRGNMFVMRTQNAVFQHWKVDADSAKAGEVTIADGAKILMEIFKWSPWFPEAALLPQQPDYLGDLP